MNRAMIVLLLGLGFQEGPPNWDALDAWVRKLGSDDPVDRREARDGIGTQGPETEALARELGRPRGRTAAIVLGVRGDDRALPHLKKLALGKVTRDRVAAIEALRKFAPDGPFFRKLLQDDDLFVALAAARATWALREDPGVVQALESWSPQAEYPSAVHIRRELALAVAVAGLGDDPFEGFERFLEMGESKKGLVADVVFTVFQHDAPPGNLKVVEGLRRILRRTDLTAEVSIWARRAILASKFARPLDVAAAWEADSSRLKTDAERCFETLLVHRHFTDWLDLVKAGRLPRKLDEQVCAWLERHTATKGNGTRPGKVAAWEAWFKGVHRDGPTNLIEAAIDRGMAWLKVHAVPAEAKNLRGLNALECLALLKGGTSPADAVLKPKLDVLRSTPPTEVYDAALRLMVLADLLPYERPARGETVTELPLRDRMKKLVAILVGAQKRNGAWGYDFNLDPDREDPYWDLSNTQFALLGLRAGANIGLEVPKETWSRAEKHLLSRMKGSPVAGKGRGADVATGPAPKGWGYNAEDDRVDWNMTCGGLSALLVSRASQSGKPPSSHLGDPEVSSAIQWLNNEYPMNPAADGRRRIDLYGLWSMERACLIPGLKRLGGRDWYLDGVDRLLQTQGRDGKWTGWGFGINAGPDYDSVETCLALLFLRRAFVPVATPSAGPRVPPPPRE